MAKKLILCRSEKRWKALKAGDLVGCSRQGMSISTLSGQQHDGFISFRISDIHGNVYDIEGRAMLRCPLCGVPVEIDVAE